MSGHRTGRPVNDAPAELWKSYGENVTDQVLEAIGNNPDMLAEYRGIAGGLEGGAESPNQNIGRFVKETAVRKVLSQGNACKRNGLAKTCSKLIEDPG